MKKVIFIQLILVISVVSSFGQWQTNGSNIYYNSGNVGIGTTTPQGKLQINGNTIINDPVAYPNGLTINSTTSGRIAREFSFTHNYSGKLFAFGILATQSQLEYGYIGGSIETNSVAYRSPWMVFKPNGNIGIGTIDPRAKLNVTGDFDTDILSVETDGRNRLIVRNDLKVFTLLHENALSRNNGFITFNAGSNANNGFLSFGSSGLERMRISPNGNVGIGTTSPSALLHLHSDQYTSLKMTYSQGGKFAIRGNDDELVLGVTGDTGIQDIQIGTHTSGQRTISFAAGGRYRMKMLANGNIGIGTTSPERTLDVVGIIRAHEIQVNTQKTADFVFEEDYRLKPLEEVAQFITENKHLPDIAPADTMLQNGVNMGEFQIRLLQKIEELTLYAIEQEKERVKQNEQIEELRQQVDQLLGVLNEKEHSK